MNKPSCFFPSLKIFLFSWKQFLACRKIASAVQRTFFLNCFQHCAPNTTEFVVYTNKDSPQRYSCQTQETNPDALILSNLPNYMSCFFVMPLNHLNSENSS